MEDVKFAFEFGGKVKMKTGSPDMMIESINYSETESTGIPHYTVSWFDELTRKVERERGLAEHLLQGT